MNRLWTPWRMGFILSEKPMTCIFCDKVREERDRDNLILYRGKYNYILMNLYPYTNGHLMVIPFVHAPSMEGLGGPIIQEMMALVNRSMQTTRRAMSPHGFNVGANIGKAAGAGIDEHFHVHVVPRWQGDNNFMPVLSDTQLMPELLHETYDKLLAAGIGDESEEE